MLCKFLRFFYEATLHFSGSLIVTSNSYFHKLVGIQNELYKLCNLDGDSLLKRMAEGMKMKYEKYWGNIEKINLLLFVAVVLDPRYKMKYIVYWFNKWYAKPKAKSMIEKVRGAIDRLYAHYATEFETISLSAIVSAGGSGSCVTSDVASSSMSSASDTHNPWKSAVEEFQHHLAQDDNYGECKTEVDWYFSEASEPQCALGFDILGWWRVNSFKYKIFSHVARDVMAVPVSTVAFESTFSIGGCVLDSFKSSLSPLTVEALICCQNWLRSTSSPVNLQEVMDEVQSIDEELESGNLFILYLYEFIFYLFIYLPTFLFFFFFFS